MVKPPDILIMRKWNQVAKLCKKDKSSLQGQRKLDHVFLSFHISIVLLPNIMYIREE